MKERPVELRNLLTFQTVADAGSYGRAAAQLGYTQSTITVHIQQLEQDLGVQLFQKVGRRMALTSEGAAVLDEARQLLNLAAQLEEGCRGGNRLDGTLKVAVAETVLCYLLGPVLREFREEAPGVSMKIYAKTCAQTPESLKDGTCDLGISYRDSWDEGRFDAQLLTEVALVPVAAPEHAAIDLTVPQQTLQLPLIVDEPDSVIRQAFDDYLAKRRIDHGGTVEMWSTQAIKCCVAAGMGFTVLPRFAVEEDLAAGTLVPLRWQPQQETVGIWLARSRSRRVTAAMSLFEETLCRHCVSS